MKMLYRIIKKCEAYYIKQRENDAQNALGIDKEKNTKIHFPYILEHPELITIGNDTQILSNSRIQVFPKLVDTDPHLTIGNGCFMGFRLCVLAGADIKIGNNVLMASDVTIASENHGMDPENELPYMKQKLIVAPVTIGDNCWIGDKVIILPGTSIGQGSIIGAGAVVTKDVPAYSIAVGNPAHVIKKYDFGIHEWVKV